MPATTHEQAGATFDDAGARVFRYRLWRRWDPTAPYMAVIGLNPSTADETRDDPTIRRCIGFAKREGLGGLEMLNLFSFRATDPRKLMQAGWPVGDGNMAIVAEVCVQPLCARVVLAWGSHAPSGTARSMVKRLRDAGVAKLWCFGRTSSGCPRHPLYLPKDAQLQEWTRG